MLLSCVIVCILFLFLTSQFKIFIVVKVLINEKENTYDLVMWEGPLTRKSMIVLTLE